MPSLLTRTIFRRIIANKPLTQHGSARCDYRKNPVSSRYGKGHTQQCRTIFGFPDSRRQRNIREPVLDPGIPKMLELDKRINLVARLPPDEQLAEAFVEFFKAKESRNQLIEDFQARLVLQTLQVLELGNQYGTEGGLADLKNKPKERALSPAALGKALRILSQGLNTLTSVHKELARLLYTSIVRSNDKSEDDSAEQIRLERYVSILARSGSAVEARDLLVEFWKQTYPRFKDKTGPWVRILHGLTLEKNETELVETLRVMEQMSLPYHPRVQAIVALHFASINNVSRTKEYFSKDVLMIKLGKIDGTQLGLSQEGIHKALLDFCVRNNELEWGRQLLEVSDLGEADMNVWNTIFQAVALSGKGPDAINEMIEQVMKQRQSQTTAPDIAIFNGLVNLSISRNDPYIAERYSRLAEKWHATPNVDTFALQIRYRLQAKDYEGAISSFRKLCAFEEKNEATWDATNELVQTLAHLPTGQPEIINELAAHLSEYRRTFSSATVAALCSYHVRRDEYFETVDLLQTYAFQFSSTERCQIRDLLVSVTLDPTTDTDRAWDTYMIFHQIFDQETGRDIRNNVIRDMFRRQRPDLSVHVFSRMSQHPRTDIHPDEETYVAMFLGSASTREPEVLESVHNQLKLDTETEPNTRLRNALMLAFIHTGESDRAIDLWRDISSSYEGPTYESLRIALKACEKIPHGDGIAQQIWKQLVDADVDIGEDLFIGYVSALAGNGALLETYEAIRQMEDTIGLQPGVEVIGNVYNCCPNFTAQDELRQWALDNYPEVWFDVESRQLVEDEKGIKHVPGIEPEIKA